jgi:hypothetical protein
MPVENSMASCTPLAGGVGVRRKRLVALAVDTSGQIERNKREACSPFDRIFEAEDMLMAFRACFELKTVVAADVLVIDLDMAVSAIVGAGQSL